MVDAAVVGHPVQPGAQVHLALVRAQRAVGADEHVLQHVLGVLPRAGAQHLPHVGEQPLAIAVVDRAERVVAARAEECEQLLVRAQPEQGGPSGVGPERLVRGLRKLPLSATLTSHSAKSC